MKEVLHTLAAPYRDGKRNTPAGPSFGGAGLYGPASGHGRGVRRGAGFGSTGQNLLYREATAAPLRLFFA